jgi:hypothetical protein
MNTEQRKDKRYIAQDNAFAALRSEFKKVGRINDISIKGLSFSYLSELIESGLDYDSSQVDIFLSEEDGFYLSHVPCKVISEIPDPKFIGNYMLKMCRCRLNFGKLSKNQLKQLKFFIKNHTIELSS